MHLGLAPAMLRAYTTALVRSGRLTVVLDIRNRSRDVGDLLLWPRRYVVIELDLRKGRHVRVWIIVSVGVVGGSHG